MRLLCIDSGGIYKARLAAGLTQADVAYRIRGRGHKATERSIRRWESGAHAPHANVVPALAEALGVSVEALYQGAEDGEEEDEAALRRLAHRLIDRGADDLAVDLLGRVQRIKERREERVT